MLRPGPDRTLLLLGALMVALCAAVVLLFPIYPHALADVTYDLEKLARGRRWAAVVYVGALAALFAITALAARVAGRARRPIPIIVESRAKSSEERSGEFKGPVSSA